MLKFSKNKTKETFSVVPSDNKTVLRLEFKIEIPQDFIQQASSFISIAQSAETAVDWKRLQNGSDIRGVALEGVPGEHVNLTEEVVHAIGASFAAWVLKKKSPSDKIRIAIGRDSRLSGPHLRDVLVSGLQTVPGCEVYDCGIATTPAMFMATIIPGFQYDGSIMVTASHLPFNRNGMKFFTAQGGLEKADITALLQGAAEAYQQGDKQALAGPVEQVDFISVYAGVLQDKIRKSVAHPEHYDEPLKGFKIVVDAGNGSGGFFVDKVLQPLGADTTGSQFLDPDGTFPNHIPNPEDKEAMEAISHAVTTNKADLGIIFDTDVDRGGAVESTGKELNRNRLIAALAAIVLEEHPGSTIVTDSVTSTGLTEFIEKRGGVHLRFKRGYKNVINESIRLNSTGTESYLAIETSGHGAMKENYFLDDGAYLIVKILIKAAQLRLAGAGEIGSLIQDLKEPAEAVECRLKIKGDNFAEYATQALEATEKKVAELGWKVASPSFEGIRIIFGPEEGDGWALIRKSLHDPIVPINIESDREGGTKIIAKKLMDVLEPEFKEMDLTPLISAVNSPPHVLLSEDKIDPHIDSI
eukprot:CAMPEP_0184659878 /NCGR_PEP_ID=MMETSP0308-20130426/31477_1 /TAXON_ID=38269 /ORGANISM="Gloeochaete witrockiana, Strain SAG 46.84" /LENGTH=582 /DNA_ID=CAMNT_0027100041 /DNA_START=106 /DNA_END=1856 /DNA_ORIENTATION=+